MWYRSNVTNKLIHDSASKIVNNVMGEGVFEKLAAAGNLTPIEPPTVEEILEKTHSNGLALIRYRELNSCTFQEARKIVRTMKKNLSKTKKHTPVEDAMDVSMDAEN